MPPSRDQTLRQRAPAAAAAAADPAAAGASSEPGSEAGSAGAPRGPRAPGRQPYLPLSVEGGAAALSGRTSPSLDALAPTASSGLQQGLRRLTAAIGIGPLEPAKRDDDLEAPAKARAKAKRSESAELPPSSSAGQTSGPRQVPVLVEPDPHLAGGANGSAPAPGSSGSAAGSQAPRRVAFETTVADDGGGSHPLRSESANDRSEFVRGVGRVDRWAGAGCYGWRLLGADATTCRWALGAARRWPQSLPRPAGCSPPDLHLLLLGPAPCSSCAGPAWTA